MSDPSLPQKKGRQENDTTATAPSSSWHFDVGTTGNASTPAASDGSGGVSASWHFDVGTVSAATSTTTAPAKKDHSSHQTRSHQRRDLPHEHGEKRRHHKGDHQRDGHRDQRVYPQRSDKQYGRSREHRKRKDSDRSPSADRHAQRASGSEHTARSVQPQQPAMRENSREATTHHAPPPAFNASTHQQPPSTVPQLVPPTAVHQQPPPVAASQYVQPTVAQPLPPPPPPAAPAVPLPPTVQRYQGYLSHYCLQAHDTATIAPAIATMDSAQRAAVLHEIAPYVSTIGTDAVGIRCLQAFLMTPESATQLIDAIITASHGIPGATEALKYIGCHQLGGKFIEMLAKSCGPFTDTNPVFKLLCPAMGQLATHKQGNYTAQALVNLCVAEDIEETQQRQPTIKMMRDVIRQDIGFLRLSMDFVGARIAQGILKRSNQAALVVIATTDFKGHFARLAMDAIGNHTVAKAFITTRTPPEAIQQVMDEVLAHHPLRMATDKFGNYTISALLRYCLERKDDPTSVGASFHNFPAQLARSRSRQDSFVSLCTNNFSSHVMELLLELEPSTVTAMEETFRKESSWQIMCSNPNGVRIVKKMIEQPSLPRHVLVDSLLHVIAGLATDTTGNYVVQKLLAHPIPTESAADTRSFSIDGMDADCEEMKVSIRIADALFGLGSSQLMAIASDKHGFSVLQKVVSSFSSHGPKWSRAFFDHYIVKGQTSGLIDVDKWCENREAARVLQTVITFCGQLKKYTAKKDAEKVANKALDHLLVQAQEEGAEEKNKPAPEPAEVFVDVDVVALRQYICEKFLVWFEGQLARMAMDPCSNHVIQKLLEVHEDKSLDSGNQFVKELGGMVHILAVGDVTNTATTAHQRPPEAAKHHTSTRRGRREKDLPAAAGAPQACIDGNSYVVQKLITKSNVAATSEICGLISPHFFTLADSFNGCFVLRELIEHICIMCHGEERAAMFVTLCSNAVTPLQWHELVRRQHSMPVAFSLADRWPKLRSAEQKKDNKGMDDEEEEAVSARMIVDQFLVVDDNVLVQTLQNEFGRSFVCKVILSSTNMTEYDQLSARLLNNSKDAIGEWLLNAATPGEQNVSIKEAFERCPLHRYLV